MHTRLFNLIESSLYRTPLRLESNYDPAKGMYDLGYHHSKRGHEVPSYQDDEHYMRGWDTAKSGRPHERLSPTGTDSYRGGVSASPGVSVAPESSAAPPKAPVAKPGPAQAAPGAKRSSVSEVMLNQVRGALHGWADLEPRIGFDGEPTGNFNVVVKTPHIRTVGVGSMYLGARRGHWTLITPDGSEIRGKDRIVRELSTQRSIINPKR